ncbi:unnamed protein product [Adineta ricciae]|uniref:G-protein coupled receptors family 1 profile domain-containing protein n=1 Tax=Adineta ricciae TaxID=249248 RepID=A0A814HKJ2_ADIRI|nr:unnamed protein product [Adineta ricciae]CAF1011095.1 unnamed protein product [Adineta ricciae]
MSSSTIEYYTFVSQQIIIFFGIPILIAGVIGSVCNLVVFLSLKTFRENACAFYLTVMTAVDLGQLVTGLLSRILISGFAVDWTISSVVYCKFRAYCFQFFALTSYICMCLASINQFLATCSNMFLQNLSNIKLAHRIVSAFVCLWLVHGILYLVYYNLIPLESTEIVTCDSWNIAVRNYHAIGVTIIYGSVLPVSINSVFGFLAYRNIHQFDRRTTPLAQRELDKQLTLIIFIQFIYHLVSTIPYLIVTIISQIGIINVDPIREVQMQLATSASLCIYYLNYAIPFYMYIIVSTRFRRQFLYVFFEIYANKWRQRMPNGNQVIPEA